jgi:DnaJ family protein C protein 7
MVLPFFNKSSNAKKSSKPADAPTLATTSSSHASKSNPGTPPSSPDKKSHSSRVKDKDRRSSSSSAKRNSKYDRDSHPLNLPPDELRRLSSSAMSAMSSDQPTPQPMDVDRDLSSSPAPAPSSPPPASKTNGTHGDEIPRPAPPPHRYTTSPPPPSANYAATPEAASQPAQAPTIDAEEYKAAGNKFFKIKDYAQAIKEYSKGGHCFRPTVVESCAASHAALHDPM